MLRAVCKSKVGVHLIFQRSVHHSARNIGEVWVSVQWAALAPEARVDDHIDIIMYLTGEVTGVVTARKPDKKDLHIIVLAV